MLGGFIGGDGEPVAAFDGKISGLVILRQAPDPIALMDIMNWGAETVLTDAGLEARWAFGDHGELARIVDLSGHGRHGSLVNAPSLGVTGPAPIVGLAPDARRMPGRPTPPSISIATISTTAGGRKPTRSEFRRTPAAASTAFAR